MFVNRRESHTLKYWSDVGQFSWSQRGFCKETEDLCLLVWHEQKSHYVSSLVPKICDIICNLSTSVSE